MTLLALKNISLRFGGPPLLDGVNFAIERGERVCLLGRNGEGKSTLMRIVTGQQQADDGDVMRSQGLRIAEMPQDVPKGLSGTVREVIASGGGKVGAALAEYHHLLHENPDDLDRLGSLQQILDTQNGWALDARIDALVAKLDLPADTDFNALSGGLKRRALLGRALALEPELLLLDEPTNHLDLDSIAWIENFLADWDGALLFITHDRSFLRRLATRIAELDRGQLTSWPGDYDNYLRRREERLHAEAQEVALFDKKLAQEEAWIRKGIEARRTRDMGRVKRLYEMREQYAQRRNLQGTAQFTVQDAERSGKLVAEAKNLSYAAGGKTIARNFSTTVLRGDKIGIIGPNGVGKTTLLRLLLGQLHADSGEVRTGSNLEIAWFDQLRSTLDERKTVWENIAGGKEYVELGGARKHVMSYLQEFLFTPDRARSPTHVLSGGERSRLLLAQLFSQPANLLVLDEPTNDLDVETLDLLEELIVDFAGTVLVVSHDRAFLNNVVMRTLAFEGDGRIGEYIGGYDDWLRQRPVATARPAAGTKPKPAAVPVVATAPASKSPLDSKQKRELAELPGKIEKLEAEQEALGLKLATLYASDPGKAVETQKALSAIEQTLATAYARWESLESLRDA
ncbi:ATP-binding cassette domain-containing protein [Solimonas terrae]|uniref:ATP-binding protein Uup n=1 Tax=Solimonas terrae TaxID=1396819 RepID=A0A6M2BNH6_9GAMM|nr:ATP-binding cassette domain-containing protein [Solimonas terrae]NGY03880.1 ATP-binding cassette domain-containing protein [Solimonas terrae]